MRTFFAIELPADLRGEIARVQAELKRAGADVRWVRPEGVHLTLKFLGEIDPARAEPLADGAARVLAKASPAGLGVSGAGVFPDRRQPRVVWLGLGGDLDALALAQKAVEGAAAEFGFAPEKRPFRPHLTLGRVKSGRGRAALLAALEKIEPRPVEFTAREVVLFKSDLKPTGAVYTALHRLPLSGTTPE